MPTLFDPADRAAIQQRAARLAPDARARWGRFTAHEMVTHINLTIRQSLGEVADGASPGPMAIWPLNWLVIHVVPWPKGKARSPRAYLAAPSGVWQDDLKTLGELIDRFAARGPDAPWPPSSAFGKISGKSYGVLHYRHLNHHLKQFGV